MSFYDDLIIINLCLFIMFLVIISIMVYIRHSICSLTGLKNYMGKREIIKTDFFIDEFEEVLLKGDITFSDEDYCRLITVTNSGVPIPFTDFVHIFESSIAFIHRLILQKFSSTVIYVLDVTDHMV